MNTRKSLRSRTMSEKATETKLQQQQQEEEDFSRKRRKLSQSEIIEEPTDKIDPVEKLLSLTSINSDFLVELESSSSSEEEQEDEEQEQEQHNEIASVNFTKILQDNIRNYYSRKLRMNQYKDSFALLNSSQSESSTTTTTTNSTTEPISPINNINSVPFFKNVNFGSSKEYTIDDYFSYDEDEDEDESESTSSSPIASTSTPTSTPTSTTTTTPASSLYIPKINPRFSYRPPSEYGISTQMTTSPSYSQDIVNILNKRCILTGKASEMVSTGNFLINDFFL